MAFHNVGAAYTKDLSKNELAHVLLIGGTHNKQGSNEARVRIVVLLTLSLIKSHTYSGLYHQLIQIKDNITANDTFICLEMYMKWLGDKYNLFSSFVNEQCKTYYNKN